MHRSFVAASRCVELQSRSLCQSHVGASNQINSEIVRPGEKKKGQKGIGQRAISSAISYERACSSLLLATIPDFLLFVNSLASFVLLFFTFAKKSLR
jgi:hypothetical protein